MVYVYIDLPDLVKYRLGAGVKVERSVRFLTVQTHKDFIRESMNMIPRTWKYFEPFQDNGSSRLL